MKENLAMDISPEEISGFQFPHSRISPPDSWLSFELRELWIYRELLFFLVWRDIKVKYKQTVLGIGWAVIQPFFTMVVFSIFFGKIAKMPSDGVPYPIFSYAALVPWIFFANSLSSASNSLVGESNLIKKVYFPRLVIPISSVVSGTMDFLLSFLLLIALMIYWNIVPTVATIWLPVFTVLAMVTALGVGLWLSALNVQFRDIRYIIPFLIQIWLFATPIVYPSSLLPESWRILYGLNPMVGVVEGFRWALLGTSGPPGLMLLVSVAVSVGLLLSGALYFRKMENTFADVI